MSIDKRKQCEIKVVSTNEKHAVTKYSATTDVKVSASRIYDVDSVEYGRSVPPAHVDDVIRNGTATKRKTPPLVLKE